MLASVYRVTTSAEFREVKERGKVFKSPNFSLTVYNRYDQEPPRFGFITTVKMSPNSTDRARIRRILSEAVRYNIPSLKKGYSCVFLPYPSLMRTYATEMAEEVKAIFKKARLYA